MTRTDNAVLAAIASRRSVRTFTDRDMTREELGAILEAGRWAPSGMNNQPWRFLVVTRADPRMEPLAGCTKHQSIVRRCAALVLVFLERERMYHAMKDHQSAGACLQNMLLAAHSLGLGGVWLGEMVNQADGVCAALGLAPETYEFQAALALGRPAAPGASSRKDLAQLLLEPLPD